MDDGRGQLQSRDVTAVVLAGGFGTRIRHVLGNLPKPLAPVHGYPFLHWVIRYLAGQGIRNIVLSTHFEAEQVERFAEAMAGADLRIECVKESSPLGTAGGFMHCVSSCKVDAPAILVANGDSLVLEPLARLISALDAPEVDGAMVGLDLTDASRFGRLSTGLSGNLTAFVEKSPGAGTINAGMYLFRRALLKSFPDRVPLSFELDVFQTLIATGRHIRVVRTESPFIDIGTEASLKEADAFVSAHQQWLTGRAVCC